MKCMKIYHHKHEGEKRGNAWKLEGPDNRIILKFISFMIKVQIGLNCTSILQYEHILISRTNTHTFCIFSLKRYSDVKSGSLKGLWQNCRVSWLLFPHKHPLVCLTANLAAVYVVFTITLSTDSLVMHLYASIGGLHMTSSKL